MQDQDTKAPSELKKLSGTMEMIKSIGDFLEKTHKLFLLRDEAVEVYDNTVEKIKRQHEHEFNKSAGSWTYGFAAGAAVVGIGAMTVFTSAPLLIIGLVGLAAGVAGGVAGYNIADFGPYIRREDRIDEAKVEYRTLVREIDSEVKGMEKSLIVQPAEVRSEFREAFRLAVTKQNLREDRIHRKKVEEGVEKARDAAQGARAAAASAAALSAISIMRR